jgi:hypothetical protein
MALADRQVFIVPAVLTELLSDPALPEEVPQMLSEVPLLEVEPGYWQRVRILRAKVLPKGRHAWVTRSLPTVVLTGAQLFSREIAIFERSPVQQDWNLCWVPSFGRFSEQVGR